jgi:FG-GAP-like repeat
MSFQIQIVTNSPPPPDDPNYSPKGVIEWAYANAALFFNPAIQPQEFLYKVGSVLRVDARQVSSTDPVYRNAEYYNDAVLSASGYARYDIWHVVTLEDRPNIIAKEIAPNAWHKFLQKIYPQDAGPPASDAGGGDALDAGLVVGKTGLWQQQAIQIWQREHPSTSGGLPAIEPSAAATTVVNVYQRQASIDSDDYTVGGVDFHIIIGPNLPQTGDLAIYDQQSGTPLYLSGNDLVFEAATSQTIYAGNGNSEIFLSGGANVVYPGMDSDLIVGNDTDALDYAAITGSVTVDLSAGAAKKSNGGTDSFGGIHIVIGSPANDAITCDSLGDVIAGGGDVISPAIATAYTPAGAIGTNWTIIGTKDVSGDGKADYLWANAGKIDLWTISNGVLTFAGLAGGAIGSDWTAKTTGDFNHDGFADVLWVNAGRVAVWELQGTAIIAGGVSNGQIGTNFSFKGVGDFNHDGNSDVVWQSNTGQVAIWLMQGPSIVAGGLTNAAIGTDWTMGGTGDFNGDGRDDPLWFNSSGQAVTWLMNGTTVTSAAVSGTIGAGWKVGGIADMNMDGKADVVWWNPANNAVAIWYMKGLQVAGSTMISNGGQIGTDWKLSGVGDVTGDGVPDIVWTRPNGSSVIWNLRGNGDQLIGGAGRDTFQINTLSEMGEVISNFQPGAGQDVLDLHNLLTSIGHGATDAFADGTVRLIQDGTTVEVEVDTSPGEHHYVRAATLQNVAASTLVPGNFQVSASAGSSGEAGSDEQGGNLAVAGSASLSDPGAQFAAPDSTSQIVQAMAGFGGDAGAADGMNPALGIEALQPQQFLTAPQHA